MHPLLSPENDSEILRSAQNHIRSHYQQADMASSVLHHELFAQEQAQLAAVGTQTLPLTKAEQEAIQLVALFRTYGQWKNPAQALDAAARALQSFLQQQPAYVPHPLLQTVWTDLAETKTHSAPAIQLLRDVWTIGHLVIDYAERSGLARIESENWQRRRFDREEWNALQLRELMQARLYTSWARSEYGPQLGRNLLYQRARLDKWQRNRDASNRELDGGEQEAAVFAGLESGIPIRGAQTYFRTTYRVHINLSAIADNKANIMISVNTIMISVLITFLSYRNIAETNPTVLLPVVIFLVTGLASLTFAILSARPKVTQDDDQLPLVQKRKNLFFFGQFIQLPMEEYESAVNDILHDEELLYGNMVRDLYQLGKVLDIKYRYLTNSYNVFMVGFVATVLAFLITLL